MNEIAENLRSNNESDRADWQRNHLAIQTIISQILTKEKRMPSYKEMEMATGLSERTIRSHSKTLDIAGMRDRSRLLAEEVLLRQALRARASGGHNDAKTYFKLNYDWAEKQEVKHSGSLALDVTGVLYSQLPSEQRETIRQQRIDGKVRFEHLPDGDIRIIPVEFEEVTDENVINLLRSEPESAQSESETAI